jgi:hypothetical protein
MMTPQSFEKLTLLKRIIGQMSIAEKVAFVAEVRSKLTTEMLKTSDGKHAYSEENILSVALGALIADDKKEFEHITGFYGGGYRSEFRKGLYHGHGDVPLTQWRKEIRRLYHKIKENSAGLQLPKLREFKKTYFVTGTVGVEVKAQSEEEAIENAPWTKECLDNITDVEATELGCELKATEN